MSWPDDAFGDVFRGLEAGGFDFTRSHPVDFIVDFHSWPPSSDALSLLEARFGEIEVVEPEDDHPGFATVVVHMLVEYDAVGRMTSEITRSVAPFGGYCDCWGVMPP